MAKFKIPYTEIKSETTPAGDPIVKTYEERINEYGETHLEETGEKNIHEEIQQYKEESMIENAINRVIDGDVSMLRADGSYIDCTKMPANLIEAQQMIKDLNNTWLKLPIDVRSKYNHSVEQFVGAAGSKEWLEDLGIAATPIENINVSAPVTNVEQGTVGEAKGVTNES